MTRINAVGFEIEGGWKGKRYLSPFADGTLISDHSINGQTLNGATPIASLHVGEAVSPVISYLETNKEGKFLWEEWLLAHWPNADPPHRANRTCGFHIHLSVNSLRDYVLLTGKSFLFGARDRMHELGLELKLPEKHIFWERMEGLNSFCKLDFNPSRQMELTKANHHGNRSRYGYLNFSYNVHGTVEFRALPTFRDAKIGVRFAKEYFVFLERYLEELKETKVEYSRKLVA